MDARKMSINELKEYNESLSEWSSWCSGYCRKEILDEIARRRK